MGDGAGALAVAAEGSPEAILPCGPPEVCAEPTWAVRDPTSCLAAAPRWSPPPPVAASISSGTARSCSSCVSRSAGKQPRSKPGLPERSQEGVTEKPQRPGPPQTLTPSEDGAQSKEQTAQVVEFYPSPSQPPPMT